MRSAFRSPLRRRFVELAAGVLVSMLLAAPGAHAGVAVTGWGTGQEGSTLAVGPDSASAAYGTPDTKIDPQRPALFIARQPSDKTVGYMALNGLHIDSRCHSPLYLSLDVYRYLDGSLEPSASKTLVATSKFPSLLGIATSTSRWVFSQPLDLKKGGSYGVVVSVAAIATEVDLNNQDQVANRDLCLAAPLQITSYPAVSPPDPNDPACVPMPYTYNAAPGGTFQAYRVWMKLEQSNNLTQSTDYETADLNQLNDICSTGKTVGQSGGDVWAVAHYFNGFYLHAYDGYAVQQAGQSQESVKTQARQPMCPGIYGWPGIIDLNRGEAAYNPGASGMFEYQVVHKCAWATILPSPGDANAVTGWIWSYPTGPGLPNPDGSRSPNTPQIVSAQLATEVPDGISVTDKRELLGGENPAAPDQPRCNTGDPIDCATGNFYESATDISLPAKGLGLSVDRTYNAQAAVPEVAATGLFGVGWSSSLDSSIQAVGGAMVIRQGNGSTVTFTQDATGKWVGASWVRSTLTQLPNGGGWNYELPDHTIYSFTATSAGVGQLRSIQAENGLTTSVLRDANGRIASLLRANRTFTFTYDANGHLDTIADGTGRVFHYLFDVLNRLTLVTDPYGKYTNYVYDSRNRMKLMTSPRGEKTANYYDTSDRVIKQVDPAGNALTLAYSGTPDSSQTIETDRDGIVTQKTFANGLPITETRGYGTSSAQTVRMAHNELGLLKRLTGTRNQVTSYEYDANGHPTQVTDPNGGVTTSTYDPRGHLTSTVSPEGRRTTLTYDSRGNVLTETHDSTNPNLSGTSTTSFTYDAYSELTASTDSAGHKTTFTYDSRGDLTKTTTPAGRVTTRTYDARGGLLTETLPAGNVAGGVATANQIVYTRDVTERPLTVTDATGGTTTFAYDADGNLVSTKDADGNLTTVQLDQLGRTIQQTNPDGGIDKWAYTGEGKLVTHTNPAGYVTLTYGYDALGRQASRKDAYGNVTTIGWTDVLGRQTVTAPNGTQVRTDLDSLGRVSQVTPVDTVNGSTPPTKYTYDGDGNVIKAVNGTAISTLKYDALGRLTSHGEDAQDARLRTGQTGFVYDAAGNLSQLQYPTGSEMPDTPTSSATQASIVQVDYTYDADDQMVSATDFKGRQFTFTYDANGALSKAAYPLGAATYTRDAMGRPTQITTPVGNRSYSYSPAGVPRSVAIGSTSTPFTVDASDRLTGVGGQTLTYDNTGALTATSGPGAGNSATYQSQLDGDTRHRVVLAPGQVQRVFDYTFDTSGRRTREQKNLWSTWNVFTYNEQDQLVGMSERTRTGAVAGTAMTYGPTGLRFTTSRDGVKKTERWEDGLGSDTAPLLVQGLDSYVYGPGGMILERINGGWSGPAEFQWQDNIGTVIGGTSESGVATPLSYDAWGHRTDASEVSPTTVGTLGFAGQEQEPGEDITYMRARYYDPAVHQFLTRDPQVEITNEPYNYAGNNPVLNTDPSGESFESDFANGVIQGASGGLLKPGSAAGSCSWAYFLGLQAGGALDPIRKAKKLKELLAEAKRAAKVSKGAAGGVIAAGAADEGYHYTRSQAVASILEEGLRPGSYVTSDGTLSPLQAQIDLALPPNRGLPGSVIRVDLAAMRKDGYDIGDFVQATRNYGMPGGGMELQIAREVDPKYLSVVRP